MACCACFSVPSFATEISAIMPYNHIVTYGSSSWMRFADFDLRYAGSRTVEPTGRVAIPVTFQQFDVRSGAQDMQRVEWSSGLGEISPQKFVVDNKNYFLELRSSIIPSGSTGAARYGQTLADNELVVLTGAEHTRLMDALTTHLNAR